MFYVNLNFIQYQRRSVSTTMAFGPVLNKKTLIFLRWCLNVTINVSSYPISGRSKEMARSVYKQTTPLLPPRIFPSLFGIFLTFSKSTPCSPYGSMTTIRSHSSRREGVQRPKTTPRNRNRNFKFPDSRTATRTAPPVPKVRQFYDPV